MRDPWEIPFRDWPTLNGVLLAVAVLGLCLLVTWLALVTMSPAAHAASYNGATWEDASPCDDLAVDLTYSIRAVVTVPAGTAPSSSGRSVYAAASDTTSTAYVYLGFRDNALLPSVTHRTGSAFYTTESAAQLTEGPHTLCAVADGTLLRLYVDGALVSPGGGVPLSGAQPSSRGLCTIGALRRSSGTSSFWIGEIESVRTWDRALTTDELAPECGSATPEPVEPAHGHTLLIWDVPTNTPEHGPPQFFQVERQVYMPGAPSSWAQVFSTSDCNRAAFTDEDGIEHPAYLCDHFPLLKAPNVPREGVEYEYRVRQFATDGLPSEWSAPYLMDPQDPTKCYSGGQEIPCP